jgi:hypothetical protein
MNNISIYIRTLTTRFLSKSKCWYSNNCLHFLKRTVPLVLVLFVLHHPGIQGKILPSAFAAHAVHQVLMVVDDNSALILCNPQGILVQQLMPQTMH